MAVPPPRSPRDGEPPAPALVGRGRELAMLDSLLGSASAGLLRVALLGGEPGIGKSALLAVLARRAADRGWRVLRGGASEAEGMPPYLPFLQALGAYVRGAPLERLVAEVGTAASPLAPLLPELYQRLGALAPGYPLPSEQARFRLYEAVGDFLAAIAAGAPTLLILDDLHWADRATLELLVHVVRQQPDARLLIGGAYREAELGANPALESALADLGRLRALTSLALGALSEADGLELATALLGAPAGRRLGRMLHAHSEGNPFYAEELLRAWLESGALVQTEQGWEPVAAALPELPRSIVSVVRQRLARLPADTVGLLGVAAVIGRRFDLGLLARASGGEIEGIEALVQPALRAEILRPAADDLLAFSHDKVRECLYADVTPLRRRRLHGFIGRALEEHATSPSASRAAELAFHFGRSGDRARGAAYAQQAAEQAVRASAPDEALVHYRAALELLECADARRGGVLLALGDAAMQAGAEPEAVAAFQAARDWFRQTGQPLAEAQAAHRLGLAWWRQEAIAAARDAFEAALTLLEAHPGPELVRVLVNQGSLLSVSLHQQAAGVAASRRALVLAQRLADARLVATASRMLGNLLVRGNDLAAGIPLLEGALAATPGDDPAEAAECCACLATAYFWRGALEQSREMGLRRLALAERCHDPYQLRHAYTWLAVIAGLRGEPDAAERLLDQAQQRVERLASPEPLAYLRFCRGALAYLRGDLDAAERWLAESIALFRAIGPGGLVWYLGLQGLVRAARGDSTGARADMDELEELLAGLPQGSMPTGEPLAYLAETALLLGDTERLARYAPKLAAFRGQFNDFLMDRLLGRIETLHADWRAAGADLAAAETTARREGLTWELARTLEARADLALARRGRTAEGEARGLLGEALELVERQGNQREAQRLRARLRRPGRRPSRSLRRPAGLSEREVEVLRLLAGGRSNRQIAAALVLSEKTVENHLTSIYGKIGADNRVAAATFAIRHGLA